MTAELAAHTQLAFDIERSLVPHQRVLNDRQAQAGSALAASSLPTILDAIKAFSKTGNMLARHTFSRVADL